MAELVVDFALRKLGEMIVKEAELLGGVGDQVKGVETELRRIQCCLRDADSKRRNGDERVQNWLNELRDVAYRIEDTTDTFYLELEVNRHKDPSFWHQFKTLFRNPVKVPVLHQLTKELGKIQKELEGIFRSKDQYDIKFLQEEDRGEAVILPKRRAAYHEVDETEVVGLDVDKNNVLKLLSYEETPRRAVITIVGPGGLGKTTLARMVYKSAREDFQYHIMLSVSKQFNLTDLLRKMLKYSEPRNQDVGELMSELNSLLSKQRYLIILDDVWKDSNVWDQLQDAFPDHNNGSRVLITTREVEVAKSADPNMAPYKPDLLSDDNSRDLLLRKALPHQNYPSNIHEIANRISKKCNGLPLALIVMGGILRTKEQIYSAWERVLRTMDWHSDGKDCMDILAMSYKDMPYTLKACFLYLSSFPEDFELSAKYLIRMWIAEGFIPQNDKKTMEETAEDYLEQLFHRSMVQVLRRSSTSGLIKYCRIHDLIRELAMHKAAEENFVTFFPKPQGANHPHLATRRASLQLCNPQSVENVGKNTRSLLWFGLRDNLPNYSEYRLIRVLEIEGVKMSHVIELRGLEQLIHLKYLGFRNCEGLSISTCPFGRLRNLETLDLRGILMPYGPSTDLWTIRTLRHVLYNECFSSDIPAKADLRNLQTLQWISSIETWKTNELPRLDNLRKLGFSNGDTGHWDAASDLFGVLPSLISLHIKAGFQNEIPLKIVYPSALPNYKNLQNLHLDGKWPDSVTLEARLFPHHLIKLTLIDSELGQDPMLELGKLESLMKLRLEGFAYNEKQMICPRGFPVLQSLVLKLGGLTILTVEKGVMPKLRNLTKSYHIKLDLPLELNHLTYNYLLD